MGFIFASRAQSTVVTDFAGKTLADLVALANVPGLTWQDFALFNWGTKSPREVNRALAETIGCSTIDYANPGRTAFDTTRGPTTTGRIYLPKLWTGADGLAPNQAHTVTVRKRRPPPVVSITMLPRWIVPSKAFNVRYGLQGLAARADKVDFEVHVTRYFAEDAHGQITPSGTQGPDPSTTHIFQDKGICAITGEHPPSVTLTYGGWKGESDATAGVLEKKGGGTFITHACAPYSVMLRYYADTADAEAKLLLAPFYPRWKQDGTTLDDASLVVKWTLSGDHGKLKEGQLTLSDKDDKIVFEIALDAARLSKKSFDLLNDAPYKLDRTKVTKKGMPYRVHLQAHSDAEEDKGLAVATMHTAVKAMLYDKAQFVSFDIKPATNTAGDAYLGVDGDDADIDVRVDYMTRAIVAAKAAASTDEDVLKIFMAPEFYWRGKKGGYVQDKLSSIVPKMRKETDKFDYADWLFVFGTAIGYVEHSAKGTPLRYGWQERPASIVSVDGSTTTKILVEHRNVDDPLVVEQLAPHLEESVGVQAWKIKQGTTEDVIVSVEKDGDRKDRSYLNLKSKTLVPGDVKLLESLAVVLEVNDNGPETKLRVKAPVCARIPHTVSAAVWKVEQGTVHADVARCACPGPARDVFWLTLSAKVPGFVKGPLEIVEPPAVETMNVALVQKGWPAAEPDDKVLKAAVIYKEFVSLIDYIGPYFEKPDWGAPDGSGRKITYTYAPTVPVDVTMLPTEGSRDTLGARPNTMPHRKIKPRTWGDGKTIGSEINKSGLGGGSVVTIDDVTFGIEICRDHLVNRLADFYEKEARPGDPQVQVLLIPSWGASIGGGKVVGVPKALVFNVDGARCDSVARVFDGTWSCDQHRTVTATASGACSSCPPKYYMGCIGCAQVYYDLQTCPKCSGATQWVFYCQACSTKHYVPAPFTAPKPTVCTGCAKTVFVSTEPNKNLALMGTSYTGTQKTVSLAGTVTWTDYFKTNNNVVVYQVRPIPKPGAV